MKKYKIAFLGLKGIPAKHGADRVVESLIRHLSDEYDITVYCKRGYSNNPGYVLPIRRFTIPTVKIKYLEMFIYLFLSALHALYMDNYDLIHIHNIDCAFIIPLLKKKYKNRIIATSHGSPYIREKWPGLVKRFFRYMEKIFINYSGVLTAVAHPLQKYYELTYGKKVHYIPNGCNFDEKYDMNSADELLRKYNIGDDSYLLFAAGRIMPSKGCHVLIDAYNQTHLQIPLVIIGDMKEMPEYSESLRQKARDRIIFAGFVEKKEILMGVVKRAKIFIFPSSYEAASMMLLEAVSLGVPVIASDISENKNLLDMPEAFFFRVNDVDDLSRKLVWAMNNYQQFKQQSQSLSMSIRQKYDWKKIAGHYRQLYSLLLPEN